MRITLNKEFSSNQYIVLALLFFASMNLFAKYFYFIFFAFIIQFLLNKTILKIDGSFIILLLFSFIYILFSSQNGIFFLEALKQFGYPMCYAIGLNFLNDNSHKRTDFFIQQKQITISFTIVALGAFVHYLLNLLINMGSVHRNNVDVWSGEVLNATGQAALSAMAVAVFVVGILSTTNKFYKVFSVVGIVIVLWYNLVLAGRTLIILTIMTLLICMIYVIINSNIKHKMQHVLMAVVLSSVFVIMYIKNMFGLRDTIIGSNLSNRLEHLEFLEDIRLSRKYQYIMLMGDYPFGGGKIHSTVGGYAHGLLLDVYSDAGIFAYIILSVFLLLSIKTVVMFLKTEGISHNLKLLVLCIHVTIFSEFLIEPILAGLPWLLCSFCFFQGQLKSLLNKNITPK